MCGIAGIINQKNRAVEEAVINNLTDAVAHRGPDGRGVLINNNVALGHRRLSIIDLSTQANQPMCYGDDLAIVFNGEIYNYLEIKSTLIKQGFTFKTHSDTEVILAAYKHWGKNCLQHFNGMWAFAIYDKKNQEIFCARDRFGVKPFYYATINNQWVFGSEIKQLLTLQDKATVNKQILADYLIIGFEEHQETTFFENISKLMPAHYLTYNLAQHTYKIEKYYEVKINSALANLNEEDSIQAYKNVFESSINLRLRSDVKVGTCLSGGIDSSAVALFASKQYTQQGGGVFNAIHASSTEKLNDESSYAKIVSDYLRLQLYITQPTKQNFEETLNKVIEAQEEPFGSPSIMMQYFVMQKAKETGTTVMLDGQGGDETFLGYERYFPALVKALPAYKKPKALLNFAKYSKLSIAQTIFYYFYFTNANVRINRLKQKAAIYNNDFINQTNFDLVRKLSESYNDVHALQKMEISTTQLTHLLKYEDRNSMAHGIEARLPFLDFRCVETALSLNNEFKISKGWSKFLLRKMINQQLPDDIVWRKNKIGFEAPVQTWLSNNNNIDIAIKQSHLLNSILKKQTLNTLDFKTRWKLYNVALWEQRFL